MRINSDPARDGAGQGQDKSSEERRQRFRTRHALGQEVEGEVRRDMEEGMAWVDVGGLELSARVPFKARPGQRLLLRIESLEPEIMLKFIKQLHSSAEAMHTRVQVQAYTAMRSSCDLAWQDFLRSLASPKAAAAGISLPEQATVGTTAQTGPGGPNPLWDMGEACPAALIQHAEQEVMELHRLYHGLFMSGLESDAAVKLADIGRIQSSHLKLLQSLRHGSALKAWAHVLWSGLNGVEKELLLLQDPGQKIETLLCSGVWPQLGAVFITALCLNGEISCRINTQKAIPFGEAAPLLNLAGLGAVLRLIKKEQGLAPWPATRTLTCLEYRERPADSVAAIILRMQAG